MGFLRDLIARYQHQQARCANLDVYKQALLEAANDGQLRDCDMEELSRLKARLQLTDSDVADMGVEVYQHAVSAAVGRTFVTERDQWGLARFQDFLGLDDSDLLIPKQEMAVYLAEYERYRGACDGTFDEITVDNIVLHRQEKACWEEPARLMEPSRGRHISGQSSGVSVRVAKGFYYRAGSFEGLAEPDDDLVSVSNGRLIITNQRVIFAGDTKSFSTDLAKILSIEMLCLPYGLQVSAAGGSTTKTVHFHKKLQVHDLGWQILRSLVDSIVCNGTILINGDATSSLSGGILQEGIAKWERAIQDEPGNANAYSAIGSIYAELGETKKAAENFRAAIRADPCYAHAYGWLGKVLVETGQIREGIEYYRQALELDPSAEHFRDYLSDACESLGQEP